MRRGNGDADTDADVDVDADDGEADAGADAGADVLAIALQPIGFVLCCFVSNDFKQELGDSTIVAA